MTASNISDTFPDAYPNNVKNNHSAQKNPHDTKPESLGNRRPAAKSTLRLGLLWTVFIGFALFSTWVLWQEGYWGIWQAGLVSAGSLQILFDLVIACLIISAWLRADAEAHNINPVPWMLGVLTTGTIAILLYLLVREHRKS